VDADSADATRFTRAPTRGVTANQCGVRIEGAAATRTSEVGSHRVTFRVKSPRQIGRTRRSEAGVVKTQAPRADSEKPLKRHTGSGNHRSNAGDRNVIPSGTIKHGCTRVEFVDGSSLVVRISRV
jgi:hypothetical protein